MVRSTKEVAHSTQSRHLDGVGPVRASLLALVLLAVPAVAAERPNILFIMTDDHAAHAMGPYRSQVNETPCLDRLPRSRDRGGHSWHEPLAVLAADPKCWADRERTRSGRWWP
jgi:hypothetical protein